MRNENHSVPNSHPLERAHQLLNLLSDDELIDAVVYLDNVIYGNDDQPDTGDDASQDLDDNVENIGLLGTGEEEPDAGVDCGGFEPDDPSDT